MIEINIIDKDGVYKTIVLNPEDQIWQFEKETLKLVTQFSRTGYRMLFEMQTASAGFSLLRKIGTSLHWQVIYLYANEDGKLTLKPDIDYHTEKNEIHGRGKG